MSEANEKKITIAGKRYTLRKRSYDEHVELRGPGLVCLAMPAGTTLEDTDLRQKVMKAVADALERKRKASAWVVEQVRSGAIDLGYNRREEGEHHES